MPPSPTLVTLESSAYAALGASSSKSGVLAAVGEAHQARYFASPVPDIAGDPNAACFIHADGAGTKSIVSYLMYRETGSVSHFRSLAIDSMVMNTDDVACAGGVAGLALSNTIGRNRALIPDEAIQEIIAGYDECAAALRREGLDVTLCGGETADLGDLVRTLVVDSTLCARVPKAAVVDTYRVTPGDVIVGFSSTGVSSFESVPNSGIGSNGLTLARHVLLSNTYSEKYPEVVNPHTPGDVTYRGRFLLSDRPRELAGPTATAPDEEESIVPGSSLPKTSMSIGQALLSPTRPYAPLIKVLLQNLGVHVHALIHCTGGGQTKIKRFGRGVRYEKDSLFPVPPLFQLIQHEGQIPWQEMYAVFNMGHRLELVTPEAHANEAVSLAKQFGIAAKVVGRVTSLDAGLPNEVRICSPHGIFAY
jgi:phosphoribosylformylglycinamidine cyclo-ligase